MTMAQMILGWTIFLEGIWLILASVYQIFYTHVACLEPLFMTMLRLAIYFVISIILDILNMFILSGFSYGGNI